MKVPLDNTTQRNNQISSERASSYKNKKKLTNVYCWSKQFVEVTTENFHLGPQRFVNY